MPHATTHTRITLLRRYLSSVSSPHMGGTLCCPVGKRLLRGMCPPGHPVAPILVVATELNIMVSHIACVCSKEHTVESMLNSQRKLQRRLVLFMHRLLLVMLKFYVELRLFDCCVAWSCRCTNS